MIRDQLPKIGTETGGKVHLGDDEFKIFCGSRPDYEKIKMGYATESECVEALLGVNSPLDLMKEALEQQWHKASDLTPDKTLDSDHPAYMRYIEFANLFHEIMTAIDIGIAEEKIRVVLEHEDSKNGEWEFSDSKILDTQSFFSWMHDRGYPVPDELNEFLKGPLTGKDKQELGRLRAEKKAMDSTIKASIKVNEFIEKKTAAGEQIKKNDIVDFIHGFDQNLPSTRVNQIWKEIPDIVKHGPGRPKNRKT